ncbi:MAG TPA: ABC transporter permease, partial [Polyangiaceae bacterium]|nr:ABC transporter permease [Polyangiaceae bacterium]
MVRAIERKLLRDLSRLRGQVLTIVLVMACGVGSYVTMQTAYRSLSRAQLAFYEGHRFPDIFAHLKRAPNTLRARLAELPDVRFETRIVEDALLPVPGLSEPARMAIVSLPDATGAGLARLHLRRGRLPDSQHTDEAVLSEAFGEAHGLEPGARLSIVMGGARRSLLVVGVALSPEYVFAIGGSGMVQDSRRFGILWLPKAALEPVYAMDASFNDVVVKLSNPKRERATIDALDRLLGPYGGQGAYARDRQVSHMILKSELTQLEQYASVTPAIFLGVSAFLLNLVMSRLLNLQRGQIAALKALGYYDREIVAHYLKLASLVAILGSVLGVLLGAYLGRGMLDLYRPYFRFPNIEYVLEARTVAVAVLICSSFAIGGAWLSVRSVLALSPAEAMLPEAPPNYGRLGLPRWLRYLVGPSERMVLRELLRRPVRTLLSIVGVAFSVAIMVTARFSFDAVDSMMQMSFETARTEDFEVQFR